MKPYFTHLPIHNYDGYVSIDILSRVIAKSIAPIEESFYFNYVVKEGERADMVASDFYGDPNYVWIIYLVNNIIDPVHDWTKTEADLYKFITQKYGSYANAANKIVYYRNNYDTDNTELTVAEYNALPVNPNAEYPYNLKRFYEPIVDIYNTIIAYKRAPLNESHTTNYVVELQVESTDGYNVNERVFQYSGSSIVGIAYISAIMDDKLVVMHVSGNFTNGVDVVGENSGATSSLVSSAIIYKTIPDLELVYFSEVSALDHETELNERKKIIKMIRPENVGALSRQLKRLFA